MGGRIAMMLWTAVSLAAMSGLAAGEDRVAIDVTIRSAVDSSPIPEAEVTLERVEGVEFTLPFQAEDVDRLVITRATTGQTGKTRLRELPAGPMRVLVHAAGFVSTEIPQMPGDQPRYFFEFVLSPAVEVSGVLRDESGVPLRDAKVRIPDVLTEAGRSFPMPSEPSATTDEDGAFRISGLPRNGMGGLVVERNGMQQLLVRNTSRFDGRPLDVVAVPCGALHVSIAAPVHRRGQYVVRIVRRRGAGVGSIEQERPVPDRGPLAFLMLPPGHYRVTATIAGAPAHVEALTGSVEIKPGETASLELKERR